MEVTVEQVVKSCAEYFRRALNGLSDSAVYDNAQGNASPTANKTSVYVVAVIPTSIAEVYRICNISTSDIDNVDDFAISTEVLAKAIHDMQSAIGAWACPMFLLMNYVVYDQLAHPSAPEVLKWRGIDVVIASNIGNAEETLI